MELFVAPTIGFDLLYAFIIVRLARRDLLHARSPRHSLGMRPRAT